MATSEKPTCDDCGNTVPSPVELRGGVCLECKHKARESGTYGTNSYFGPNGENY